MVFNSLFLIGAKDIWKIPFLRLKKTTTNSSNRNHLQKIFGFNLTVLYIL